MALGKGGKVVNHKKRFGFVTMAAVTFIVFGLLVVVSMCAVNLISQKTNEAQLQQVEAAVRSAARACYAAEGAYPFELAYLKDHYGLFYDESVYTVTYSAFANNVFPDIFVCEAGDGLI